MALKEHLYRSAAGVDHYLRHEADGSLHMESHQDVQFILDRNHEMLTHNDGYNADRTMRRIGTIPINLLMQWQAEEGWDPFDVANEDKLAAKLDDIGFRKLRTAPGRVGKTHRHI